MAYDEGTAARVRRVLKRRKFREAQLMGGLCFMVGGSMCCSVSGKGGLLVRIDPAKFEQVLAEPHVAPMRMGNRTMRGFVRVEPEGFQADRALERWIELGLEAAAAHSPAAGTRAKGKGSRARPRRTRK
ncbi:MAG TPA: TfoX/Sxy family protein [Steroidobacteraceae bacterium]|nr:TfoX/Sxy family protein [Steroidobacteraceae bacterium]